jgi:drug/metabolite transporter (DMT)-like permease
VIGSVGFGLLSALSWGAGDFAGGLAARRLSVLAALAGGQTVGLVAALCFLAFSREAMPSPSALGIASLAGLSGLVGLASFFRALASGPMGLVAPAVAVIGAGVPALVGIARGDDLSAVQIGGLVAALIAVTIASRPSEPGAGLEDQPGPDGHRAVDSERSRDRVDTRASLWLVVFAGLGFAGFYLMMNEARGLGAELWWPVSAARSTSLIGVLVVAAITRSRLIPPRAQVPLLLASGLGDLGGNTFFVLANAIGPLSIAAVTSSLYPVTTVLLARVVLGEKLSRLQLAGVGLALVGIVLITI